MKTSRILKFSLGLSLLTVGSMAFGSHVVCSSPTLYYSSVRYDFGTAPRPGAELGKLTIFGQGKLLVSQTFFEGLGNYTTTKYGVTFAGPKKELARTGNQTAGSLVYTDVAVLKTQAPFPVSELDRSPVVCEQTWAMVP